MTLRWGVITALLLAAPSARGAPAEYSELVRATRAALAKKSFDEAADSCMRALAAVKGKEPLEEARVHELCGDVEVKRERHLEAAKRYAAGARIAGEDLKYRRKLLFLRKQEAQRAKADKSVELANDLLEADRTLDQVVRRPRRSGDALEKTLSALADAAQVYRRDRDPDRAEEALALRALVLVRSAKPDDGLRAAERVVAKSSAPKRAAIIAHEAKTWALMDRGDAEGAAGSAIMFNHLRSPEQRSPLLDRACHLYDKANGDGSCARLEIKLTGDVTFTDFSLGKRKSELTDADIERVHAEALPALEDCVLSAARRDPEFFRGVDVQLSWTIDAEGRATDVEMSPNRNKKDIMPCAGPRIAKLRYPKVFSKERKNVTIPYHLN